MVRRFAGHEIDEIVRLYVDYQWSIRRIAGKFDSSYSTVRRILEGRGVPRRRGRKFSREEIDKIVTLYVHDQQCMNDVAAELGAPPMAVYRVLRQRGLNRSRSEALIVRNSGPDSRIEYVYHLLRAIIVTGILQEGARLPNRDELRKLLGVSGHTLRAAMHDLEYDGYIVTVQWHGTFVRGHGSGPDPL